ncbi:MAG: PEGA domain-containing protein [Fibrobacteria bacterium]
MNAKLPPNLGGGASGPGPEQRMRLFEHLLRQDVEIRCDFSKLEKSLLERIQKASALGPLSVLKEERTPAPGFFDKVEGELLARIHNHREYEQPVNDILAGPVRPSAMELHRIEARLEEQLHKALRMEPWEQYLKAEVPLSMGRGEAMENALFTRIERHRKLELVAPPSHWLTLGLFLKRPAASVAAGLMMAIVVLVGALNYLQRSDTGIETLVYQAQGSTVSDLDSPLSHGRPDLQDRKDIRSKDDGAMILVNQRGFVEMHNGSSLRIEQADRKKVRYRVGFAGHGHTARGNVTFFVNKRKGNEKYQVATPDYRIEVVGTYFRVHPDVGGRVSTSVLEGKVKIHSESYGDFEIAAGQSLVYDAAYEKYRVEDGGASVRREDIETVPSVDELDTYGVVTITSDVDGAEVRIDDRYKGATPLVVMLPPGRHTLQLSKEGRPQVDTTVMVSNGGAQRLALAMVPTAATEHAAKTEPKHLAPKPIAKIEPSQEIPQVSRQEDAVVSRAEEADLIYRKADEIQAKDWQTAIFLYRKVLENPASKPLRKEAAFFSVARLRAEHDKEKSSAKEDFLRYLALYPDGAFSGESWLRLAELEVGRNNDKAIEYYLRAIEKLPRHPRLSEMQHHVGLLYLQGKRYEAAVAMFHQSLGNILYANESEKRKIYQSLYRTLVLMGDRKSADRIDKEYRLPEDSAGGN